MIPLDYVLQEAIYSPKAMQGRAL